VTTQARSAATLTALELLDALAEIRQRTADVLAWHVLPRRGGRGCVCTECGNPWPCRTVTRLTGRPEVEAKAR
jgi:hypothetical protein